ncbi:matrix protein [Avian paramyxovirus 13 goose/Kazakhstan/5751/2013]|uniref:Matrix protein n=1 Tax=Avian paramyxovirus 13 goose/Kazakhstan/5751/2013 TaxID=1820326 RepID=A0A142J1Z7_9MONO|nr:matrix protein [Avian paramyxovirus 13 goose/Kazakhstan/5751/2013]
MDSSKIIGLEVDPSSPSNTLLAFPVVLQEIDGGRKEITPQFRTQKIDMWSESKSDSVSITTYGFIYGVKGGNDTSGPIMAEQQKEPLSAAMLCFGSVGYNSGLPEIARAALNTIITCKKSATDSERILFTVHQAPQMIQEAKVISTRYSSVAANKCVRAPERLPSGLSLEYKVTFVSLTVVPKSDVYKVPRPVLRLHSKHVLNIAINAVIQIDIQATHPLAKTLMKRNDQFFADLFIHIGMISCLDSKGNKISVDKLELKIRRMSISVGLLDIFGPSIALKARGKRTKVMSPFFSPRGTACYPISQTAPGIAKILWSQTGSLHECKIIIQGGTNRAIATTDDFVVGSTRIEKSGRNGKFNPFKKTG